MSVYCDIICEPQVLGLSDSELKIWKVPMIHFTIFIECTILKVFENQRQSVKQNSKTNALFWISGIFTTSKRGEVCQPMSKREN